jgi:hypothetical protein
LSRLLRSSLLAAFAAVTALSVAQLARAQVITEPAAPPFPNPKKFARGFFAQGEVGTMMFFGRTGRFAAPGFQLGARLGYDILRWLAVQARVQGATMDATLPPPTVGQSFQTYVYDAEVRLSVQIRRWQLFAEAGAGLGQLSSNVLDRVQVTNGEQLSLAVVAGGGVDFHTLNRHFSLGVDANYLYLHHFAQTHGLTLDAYLRYTH